MERTIKGFTIVELIVVILVIGILAAISIVSYSSWKQKTTIAQLKSDLNGAVSALENSRTFNNTYPSTVPSTFVPSSGVTISGGSINAGKDYCVSSTNGTLTFNMTSKYSASLPGPCPVLYLDASNATSYSGTGTIWYDLSGNGNNGTLYNNVGYNIANGGVLSFDRVDNYVDCGNKSSLTLGTNDFNVSVWIYPEYWANPGEYSFILINKDGSNDNGVEFELAVSTTDTYKVAGYTKDTTAPGYRWMGISTTTINKNTWSNISISRTGIHPPYILHTFTKLERSESEIQEYDRKATTGLWGQDTFRVVQES